MMVLPRCSQGKLCLLCAKTGPHEHVTDRQVPVTSPVKRPTIMSAHAACEAVPPLADRSRGGFWTKVIKTDCCWLWGRARFPGTGYGAYWHGGKLYKAHRVAYTELVGPIPPGLDLMHSCDVRHCVNPEHLRPGTRAENQQDMVRKGRNAPQDGERNHHAKFTWAQIREIRFLAKLGLRQAEIAYRFDTTPRYVSSIVTGRVWKEVEEREAVA